MARIRSIKPEFWQDELVAGLPMEARLLFIGLISLADDEGRFRANPRFVAAQVFPYDAQVDVVAAMAHLERIGRVQLYEAEGQSFGWIRNFLKHQRIDKPKASPLPSPPLQDESTTRPRSIHDASKIDLGRKGREGKGVEGRGAIPAAADPISAPGALNVPSVTAGALPDRRAAPAAPAVPDKSEPGELQDQLSRAWFDKSGQAFDWPMDEQRAIAAALGKAKGDAQEVLRRWRNALEYTAFPVCGGVRDLVHHWNRYGTGPPKTPGKGRASEADKNWSGPAPEVDANGNLRL